jgi:hypothetical protein
MQPLEDALLTYNDFDSVDPFADFNFAGDELLSFLKPTEDNAGVVDFASWLHMREISSSPSSYVESAPLIEPGESEEMFTHQEKPKSSVAIDEQLYAQLKDRLQYAYPEVESAEFTLPSRHSMERFVSLFFDCFYPHFPIFHLPTFNTADVEGISS